ncbi:MAG TPA: phospholipase D-like domain-containing protein, partial [Myxococcaceae bacterium]
IVAALAARARAGVRVRLLLDAVGSRPILSLATRQVGAAGGEVRSFMPLIHAPVRGRSNLRSHRKIAVFDGRRVFLGGMNMAIEYMGPTPRPGRWRDLASLLEGPVAADAAQLFAADWAFAGREESVRVTEIPPPAGEAVVQLVPSGPEMATDTFYDALVTALYAAKSHVMCVTPYYVPDDVVQHAFVLCARRGVRTAMVMPAVSNHLLADKARRGLLPELAEAGVVFHWFGGMVHGKAMVVDDTVAYIGSPNLDMRSFFLNYEDALLLYGPPEISAVQGWIERLAAECPKTLAPPSRRRWLIDDVARLLAPEL